MAIGGCAAEGLCGGAQLHSTGARAELQACLCEPTCTTPAPARLCRAVVRNALFLTQCPMADPWPPTPVHSGCDPRGRGFAGRGALVDSTFWECLMSAAPASVAYCNRSIQP